MVGFKNFIRLFDGDNINRSDLLSWLKTKSPDVIIIGAGLNGASAFRDLALNGVDVLLIDRADFCSGASSACSHLAHGGTLHLENGKFLLAREAARERDHLIENTAHVVKPLPMVVPVFKLFSGLLHAPFKFLGLVDTPAERGALVMKIGLILHDLFTHSQGTVPAHKFEGRERSLEKHPRLSKDIKYTATSYEGQILSPGRLTVELALDGEAQGPHARALNYASLVGANGGNVTLKDELTGSVFDLHPKLIINAAGPWIDQVNSSLGLSRHYIQSAKSLCLVLNHTELRSAVGSNGFCFEDKEGGLALVLPYYDKVILGTRDIPVQGLDSERRSEAEIDHLIDLVSHIFPDIKITRQQCVFQFSGEQLLENVRGKTNGQTAWGHNIKEDKCGEIPVYSLVGGHWTSFRALGEQVTNKTLALLGKQRKADTKMLQTGGGKEYPQVGLAKIEFINKIALETGLGDLKPRKLFERYGTRALEIGRYLQAASDEPLRSKPDWTRREVQFLVENEKVVHVDDILLRRSSLAWLGEVNQTLVVELAEIMSASLGLTQDEKHAEIRRTLDILKYQHAIVLV